MTKSMPHRFVRGLLMTAALPLGLMTVGPIAVQAEVLVVPTTPGSLDGGNGGVGPPPDEDGLPGDPGQPANADAGFTVPNSDALNSATATGGAGGDGGEPGPSSINFITGNGGAGGAANAFAGASGATATEADALAQGGRAGDGGLMGGSGGSAARAATRSPKPPYRPLVRTTGTHQQRPPAAQAEGAPTARATAATAERRPSPLPPCLKRARSFLSLSEPAGAAATAISVALAAMQTFRTKSPWIYRQPNIAGSGDRRRWRVS